MLAQSVSGILRATLRIQLGWSTLCLFQCFTLAQALRLASNRGAGLEGQKKTWEGTKRAV